MLNSPDIPKTRVLEWSDPPKELRGGKPKKTFPDLLPWMLELIENQMVWAKIEEGLLTGESAGKRVYNLKRSLQLRKLDPYFEIVSRKTGPKTHGVWARYLGS